MPLTLPIHMVDAFSDAPFSGNPAGVCLCDASLPDITRQQIAAEMNLAETAFIEPMDGDISADEAFQATSHFRLRWFTPTTEVPLCGHATLASAAVLIAVRNNASPSIHFHTRSGELVVTRRAAPAAATDSADAAPAVAASSQAALLLEMSLPLYNPVDPLPECAAVRDGPLLHACTGGLPIACVRYAAKGSLNYLLVELVEGTSRQQLEAICPDFAALKAANGPDDDVHGVIVCTRGGSDSGYDVLSRFFAPWMGINEDPVTGSAHAVLGPYWAPRLAKSRMRMRQCSPRGGDIVVELPAGDDDRVLVSGPAKVVMRGVLEL